MAKAVKKKIKGDIRNEINVAADVDNIQWDNRFKRWVITEKKINNGSEITDTTKG
jgi:hypothetical protein